MSSGEPGRLGHGDSDHEFAASVPGGVITASQTGTGTPALILHGGPGLSDYTAPLAAELDDTFSVIRFQQRGLEPSTTSGPFDINRHVADAIAVLDAAGASRAYVIGHSWGGHLAMHLAAQHQDRLLGLVAVDRLERFPMAARAISTGSWQSGYKRTLRRGRRNSTNGPWPAKEPPRTPWKGWPSSGLDTSPHRTRPRQCRR
jgi:pimeloyl-ACP methyl ester carboxylesterase